MKKKYYITTTIPYANAPPHIGFALEIVQADVLARWNRLLGKDVFFLTGTDEHGKKIQEAAKKAKKSSKKKLNKKEAPEEKSGNGKLLLRIAVIAAGLIFVSFVIFIMKDQEEAKEVSVARGRVL